MKLSEWAKINGISYKTAWKWFKAGKLPVPAEQAPTGTILVKERSEPPGKVVLYARVSSADQKSDLDGQISRLLTYANEQGWEVGKAVMEIGSGLNGRRPELMKLLADPKVRVIVVEHRDRLMRFGQEDGIPLDVRGIQVRSPGGPAGSRPGIQELLSWPESWC